MKRSLATRIVPMLLALAAAGSPAAALADGKWTAGLHVGSTTVDRLVEDSGAWWSRVDDSGTALGLSIAYDYSPLLGIRLMYERAASIGAQNVCPPDATCPAVAISEEVDLSSWQVAVVPRLALGPDWSLFGTLGGMRWKLHEDNVLPGDSGTDFVYGLGLAWRTGRVQLGLEYQRTGIDSDTFRVNAGLRF